MPDVPPGPAADPHVVALSRTVERTARRVGELDALLRQLSTDIAGIAHPTTPVTRPDSVPPEVATAEVRAWLLAEDPDQARADLSDLVEWLYRVYLRYDGAALCSCWLWHPDVVEELWWLRQAHADAYHPETGSWLRVGDWHDRQRPGVARRISRVVTRCELSLHVQGQEAARPAGGAPLAVHTDQVALAWTTDPARPHPEPTTAQLADAERLNRRSYR